MTQEKRSKIKEERQNKNRRKICIFGPYLMVNNNNNE